MLLAFAILGHQHKKGSKDLMNVKMGNVRTDFDGFQELIRLHELVMSCMEGLFEIDMSSINWIEGNMCAAFGAILSPLRRTVRIQLSGLRSRQRSILQKNAFLPNFGFDRKKKPDTYGTTIEYRRFRRDNIQAFKEYVETNFVGRRKGLPRMSPALLGRFRQSIAEVFDNAVEHSNTRQGIFACGQFFPGWTNKRLDFSIADLGDGMRKVILDNIGEALAPEQAIAWAMEGENTTRQRQRGKPGGLGLKLIREFINLNGGRIQIASDAGYWDLHRGETTLRRFEHPFPGTVVNIEINTGDKQSYRLASEIDPNSIF